MQQDFLQKLQQEAVKQKKLHTTRIIPAFFDPITSYVGEHAPLVLIVFAVCSAALLQLLGGVSL